MLAMPHQHPSMLRMKLTARSNPTKCLAANGRFSAPMLTHSRHDHFFMPSWIVFQNAKFLSSLIFWASCFSTKRSKSSAPGVPSDSNQCEQKPTWMAGWHLFLSFCWTIFSVCHGNNGPLDDKCCRRRYDSLPCRLFVVQIMSFNSPLASPGTICCKTFLAHSTTSSPG